MASGDGITVPIFHNEFVNGWNIGQYIADAGAKGLGTNAVSSVVVDIPAGGTTFSSDVGVDDTAAGRGGVTFTVLADGTQVASTAVMRGGQPAQYLSATVAGASQLTLDVGDGGDGIGHDNADWGDAQLMTF